MTTSAESPPVDPTLVMRSIIQRIATGPELSKDISSEEAQAGMRYILEGNADPVQAGIFLIALRMKRETDDEVKGILDALREMTDTTTADRLLRLPAVTARTGLARSTIYDHVSRGTFPHRCRRPDRCTPCPSGLRTRRPAAAADALPTHRRRHTRRRRCLRSW